MPKRCFFPENKDEDICVYVLDVMLTLGKMQNFSILCAKVSKSEGRAL